MRRTAICALVLALAPAAALADALPEPLHALLAAAAEADDPDAFEQAVRLIALTRPAAEITASADRLSRGAEARVLLGAGNAEPPIARTASAPAAAPASAPVDPARPAAAPADGAPDPSRALPRLMGFVYEGELDTWSGQVKLGLRTDAGNTDRQDYTVGLKAQRELMGWGYEGSADYAYSETNGRVGRDALILTSRVDRERGERWTLYGDARYERDRRSGFDWTGFLIAGAGYRAFEGADTSWTLRGGPGARFTAAASEVEVRPAMDFTSDFRLQVTESMNFHSETRLLVTSNARADQVFTIDTEFGELWALELKHRYRYEFEPKPGFGSEDSRTDLSVVRRF